MAISTELQTRLLDRRNLLQKLGLWSSVAATWPTLGTGCSDEEAIDFLSHSAPPNPNQSPIHTTVMMMMENRSFDHYYASYGIDDVQNPRQDLLVMSADQTIPGANGAQYQPFHLQRNCLLDPPHGWDSSRRQFNAGLNDGFALEYFDRWQLEQIAPDVIGYYHREDLPIHFDLADHFTVFDHWFSSVLGPTLPNRYYWHSGTADGHTSNIDSIVSERGLTWKTIWHQLDEAGISWRYYYFDVPMMVLFSGMHDRWQENIFPIDAYFGDAERGELPSVVCIDPGFVYNDDHPPHHPRLGQIYISEVYHALARSPQWDESLMLLTYDEHGGFYDHVPPPTMDDDRGELGFDQLGFRVPTLAIGPYVRHGQVVSEVFEHAAACKWLSWRYGLDPLTTRVRATADLNIALDLQRINQNNPKPAPIFDPISEPDIHPGCQYGEDHHLIEALSAKARIANPHHHELELIFDRGLTHLPKHMDLRSQAASRHAEIVAQSKKWRGL